MKFFKKFLLGFLLISLCFSCAKKKPAKVLNHSKSVYGKNSELNKGKYRNVAPTASSSASPSPTAKVGKSKSQQIEIETGDSLYSIAKKYQVTPRDLIKQNELTPPYNLKVGSKMTIPAPNYYEVKSGDTLYSISRANNMKIDSLIEINDLKEPYAVKVGERIRIAKIDDSAPVAVAENKPQQQATRQVESKNDEKKSEGFIEKTLDKLNHFSWPVKGQIVSKFGPKSGGLYNDGINIKAKEGSEVKASEDGVVAYVGNELKGYGNLVIIKHSGGWITAYAHLANSSVKRGDKVLKGKKIGTVGSTGNVTSPQLYFGLRKGRDAVNPQNYLKV